MYLSLAVVCLADNLTYMRIDRSVIEKRIQTVPATDKDRIDTIRMRNSALPAAPPTRFKNKRFRTSSYPTSSARCPVPIRARSSLRLAWIPRPTAKKRLVDWGGVAMLPLLAESLNSAPHRQTLILAAFAGHDHGFAGANWYLKQLS